MSSVHRPNCIQWIKFKNTILIIDNREKFILSNVFECEVDYINFTGLLRNRYKPLRNIDLDYG